MKTKGFIIPFFYLLFYQILILTSCKNDRSPQYSMYLIDLHNPILNIKSVPLSAICSSIQYIPLETNSASLLKTILHIEFCDSIIFVCDDDKLLKFDTAGRFIKQIGIKGRGPGEYPSIYDFSVDKTNQLIYIAASRFKDILIFNFDGNLVKSFKVPYIPMQILACEMNYILFRNAFPNPDTKFNWYITDSDGKILTKFRSFPGKDSRSKFIGQSTSPMYLFDDKVHFMEYGIDTLYLFTNSAKEPYAIFDLGDLKMDPYPVDFDTDALKDKIWVYKIFEDRNNLYLKVSKGWTNTFYHCIYNKKESETITLNENDFINDLDGGPDFWPQFVTSDTILISYIETYKFLNSLNKKLGQGAENHNNDELGQLKTLKKQLTETSNPIIMVVK